MMKLREKSIFVTIGFAVMQQFYATINNNLGFDVFFYIFFFLYKVKHFNFQNTRFRKILLI